MSYKQSLCVMSAAIKHLMWPFFTGLSCVCLGVGYGRGDWETRAFWLNISLRSKITGTCVTTFFWLTFLSFFHFTALRLGVQWGRWEKEKSRYGSFDVSRCTTHSCFCRCPFRVKVTLKCSPTFLLSVWAWNNLIAHATAEGLTLTELLLRSLH